MLLAVVIVIAGTGLARCADAIAEITGWGRLLVGSVLLAGATSLPELTVDISAVRLGLYDLALGDLLGSSLMNLLILAILDLTHRSRGRMLSKAAAAHALAGTLSIALTGSVGLGIIIAPEIITTSLAGVHLSLWLVAIGYALGVRLVYLDQRVALRTAADTGALITMKHEQRELPKYVAGFVLGAVAILVCGPLLAESAGKIADQTGLGNSFVGTTLVALWTSLPELVASLTALRLGAFDMAVGNVFGSNAFNMLLLLPLDATCDGSLLALTSSLHVISVLAVILATAIAIMGQLYSSESRYCLIEPDAWRVLLVVTGSLALV